jgi:hypothetical protein
MVSRCPRSQLNASGHFARTLNKRNRHQLSRSALAHIHPTTKRLTTLQFAGAGDETVSGKEYKNITVRLAAPSPLSIAFSPSVHVNIDRRLASLCGAGAALRWGRGCPSNGDRKPWCDNAQSAKAGWLPKR